MKRFYISRLIILIAILSGWNSIVVAQTTTFSTPGGPYTYTVPMCTFSLNVVLNGGQGGNTNLSSGGGLGGRLTCTLAVTPGQILYVYVGGAGGNGNGSSTVPGGINGGGAAAPQPGNGGGSGGGGSDIRTCNCTATAANRLVVAGGGGGDGYNGEDLPGGVGGGLVGGSGGTNGSVAAGGGSQIAGGTAGNYTSLGYTPGSPGAVFQGGSSNAPSPGIGGGGGGGYYGGGGSTWGSGGGGSSYAGPGATIISNLQGVNSGGGSVTITPLCTPPLAGVIVGSSLICPGGSTETLSDPTGSACGVWSSSNTAVASVGPTTGVVTSGITGNATISYVTTLTCGTATATGMVTVNSLPPSIGGTPSVCTGAITTLTDGTTGGTWGSSNTAVGAVDGSGNVTGVTIGTTTITYTAPSTCYITTPVTVNGAPGPIGGTAVVCSGSTTVLTDVVSGGIWSSSAGGIATITSGGVLGGGNTAGTSNIVYTLPTGCTAAKIATVNALPPQFPIIGSNTYCADSSNTMPVQLFSSTSGVSYQLFSGGAMIGPPVPGTNSEISFGIPPGPGTYTAVGTNTLTGCVNNMGSSAVVAVKTLPTPFLVTGGGSYCQFTGGVLDSLQGSTVGITYKLYNNGVYTSEFQTGTGSALGFGLQTAAGTYTVVGAYTSGTPSGGCPVAMTGSAIVSISALPTVHNVTGGGYYCTGSLGDTVGLDYADPGISYQLLNGLVPAGRPVMGTGGPLSFGYQTVPGLNYNVIATNTSTRCTNNMAGSVFVFVATPPTAYSVFVVGDPTGCVGSSNPQIWLSNSDPGVNYQVYDDGVPVGSAVGGSGSTLELGSFTASGTYTVIATDQTYFCVNTMTGSITINLSALPVVYNVTGGGSYCAFGTGVPVMLEGSQTGVTYKLFNSFGDTTTLPGTGGVLNFGDLLIAGTYTASATSDSNCASNMAGSATIAINPLPTPFNVFGGGSYCAGGTGIDIGLDFSAAGVNYQLYDGGISVGAAIAGTGDSLDFGSHIPSGTYTIVGTNPATGCTANMSGSATIIINPLPGLHTVTGGGSYCSGGSGKTVSLDGSNPGISYQLFNGITAIGSPDTGTGAAINFGLQTLGGTYTVVATDITTQCTKNMSGAATIVVNVTPSQFSVTGGGIYCPGTAGVPIGLSGSNASVHYLLYNGSTLESTVAGTGSAINFGLETVTGTYTVTATNVATGCTNNMTGDAVVATYTLPTAYSVIGGGNYCSGSSTIPSVGLGGSDAGVNYQLYYGTVALGTAVGGTGAPLNFGTQPAAGIYTVVATNVTTGCTKNMSGSAAVIINPLPPISTVTGGGSYCAGGDGTHIYMSISNPGIDYILYRGTTTIDTVTGTGAGVDFGLQTTVGSYTAVAIDPASGCISNMAGSATISINSLPAAHTVTVADGGNYCVTGSGVAVGLDGSNTGIKYQLYNGVIPVGTAISGTGIALNFGIHAAGNYTITGTDQTTGCKNNMTGSAVVNAIPLPNVYATTGGGNYCTTGLGLHIGLSGSDAGTQYQLYHGASPIGIPVTGTGVSPVDFGLFTGAGIYTVVATNGGSLGCNNNMSGSAVIAVYPVIIPNVSIATAGGDTACEGVTTYFTASSVNGGPSPVYTWSVNGAGTSIGSSFSYVPMDGDMVTVAVQSDGICAIPDTASATIRMAVSPPQLPSVNVMASPGDIVCQGTLVTFNATPLYAGFHPTYTWLKNSVAVASSGLSYTYTPANNDIIVVLMGSSFPCRTADSVFSNPTRMEVDPPVIPKVIITVNPGTQIAPGQNTTLTASVVNGGSAPKYQWLINGAVVNGATNDIYISNSLANNDSVTCQVIGACDLLGFNSVRMHVGSEGVQQITGAGTDNIKLVPNPNKGMFTIKGTLGISGDEEVSIEVVNMIGQVVYSGKAMTQNGNINESIQISGSVANGMYILNLRSGTQNTVFHFVIEQ